MLESELRTELCKMKNFERLNNEKITPYFLKMARSSKRDECLEDLRDDGGVPFVSEAARSEYITSYF